jgi:predicted RNA-binding Zn-ribbon protein involved in translation (DUF1610 family)
MGDERFQLSVGAKCPICELGKGLTEISAIELALAGFENYEFLHCPICGANFIKRKDDSLWQRFTYQAPEFS